MIFLSHFIDHFYDIFRSSKSGPWLLQLNKLVIAILSCLKWESQWNFDILMIRWGLSQAWKIASEKNLIFVMSFLLILSHFRSFLLIFLSHFIDHFYNIFRSSKPGPWILIILFSGVVFFYISNKGWGTWCADYTSSLNLLDDRSPLSGNK